MAYQVTQQGVSGLTHAAAMEYAPRGIRVDAVTLKQIEPSRYADMAENPADALD